MSIENTNFTHWQDILVNILHLNPEMTSKIVAYKTPCKSSVMQNFEFTYNEQNILTGIAQGSILGATLFLIHQHIQLYADDAVLMFSANTHFTILQQMKQDAEVLNRWFSINRIKMNFSKSNFILFGSEERNLAHISIEREQISEVKFIKYLGLIN
jgi:hypothetical protein